MTVVTCHFIPVLNRPSPRRGLAQPLPGFFLLSTRNRNHAQDLQKALTKTNIDFKKGGHPYTKALRQTAEAQN